MDQPGNITEGLELAVLSSQEPASTKRSSHEDAATPSFDSDEPAGGASSAPRVEMEAEAGAVDAYAIKEHPGDGRRAWAFLSGISIMELLIFGLSGSYGVFVEFFDSQGLFQDNPGLIPLVGTLAYGLMTLLGPLWLVVLGRWPLLREPLKWIGLLICTAALLGSAFTTTASGLLATQGVLFAVGGSALYYPAQRLVPDWFIVRRGLAGSIIFAGTSVAGLVLPLIFSAMLTRFGFRTTMIALAVFTAAVVASVSPLQKPRTQRMSQRQQAFGFDAGVRKAMIDRSFLLFLGASFMQGLSNTFPFLWLPSFAAALGLSSTRASSTLSILSGIGILPRLYVGHLTDKAVSPHLLAQISLIGQVVSTLLLWGLASTSYVALAFYCVVYGVFGPPWTSLWNAVVKDAAGKDQPHANFALFTMLSMSRGVAQMLVAPISSALQSAKWTSSSFGFGVDGGHYAGIILFTGACCAVAGGIEAEQLVKERR